MLGGFRVPHDTGKSQKRGEQSSVQDVQRGIFVSIQNQTAGRTDMGTDGETLFDACAKA